MYMATLRYVEYYDVLNLVTCYVENYAVLYLVPAVMLNTMMF